ncbi:hypothetical protein BELL_0411g00070 [Botrytis elliptica]|uniref:Uncharacterized protein n=1 Tax=Botrytis elliptica TaxID=278938 RepID=A0A4Z1JGT0_9HELO|nr:hypothetical protein BELL_0411g00070 [Botrytis elliptica]
MLYRTAKDTARKQLKRGSTRGKKVIDPHHLQPPNSLKTCWALVQRIAKKKHGPGNRSGNGPTELK